MFFPDNAIAVLAEHLAEINGVEAVVLRAPEPTDPNGCLSIVCDEYVPEEMQMGSFMPAAGTYRLLVSHLVKNSDAEEGNRTHRLVAKAIRLMLYRDQALRVALGQLQEADTYVERILKWDVPVQRYGSNEISGQFIFLSVTELNIHTETA